MSTAFCTPSPRMSFACRRRSLVAAYAGKGFGAATPKSVSKKNQEKPHYVRKKGTCPCGSGSELKACCGPIIDGVKEADTAEDLMRSRFSAYCLQDVSYIVDTTHPDVVAREGSRTHGKTVYTLKDDVRATATGTEFHKLKILSTEAGGPGDDEGLVRFTIWFKNTGESKGGQRGSKLPMQTTTELSSFKRSGGRWSYADAVEYESTA